MHCRICISYRGHGLGSSFGSPSCCQLALSFVPLSLSLFLRTDIKVESSFEDDGWAIPNSYVCTRETWRESTWYSPLSESPDLWRERERAGWGMSEFQDTLAFGFGFPFVYGFALALTFEYSADQREEARSSRSSRCVGVEALVYRGRRKSRGSGCSCCCSRCCFCFR